MAATGTETDPLDGQRTYLHAILTGQEAPALLVDDGEMDYQSYAYLNALFLAAMRYHLGEMINVPKAITLIDQIMDSDDSIPAIGRYMMYESVRIMFTGSEEMGIHAQANVTAMATMIEFIAEHHGYDAGIAEFLLDEAAGLLNEFLDEQTSRS